MTGRARRPSRCDRNADGRNSCARANATISSICLFTFLTCQTKMTKLVGNVTLIASLIMHLCIVLSAQFEDEAVDEQNSLKVEIVDKPAYCETSSQRGNLLKVHYTGYLLDGQKFDSRSVHK